jgi:hypothetical protein
MIKSQTKGRAAKRRKRFKKIMPRRGKPKTPTPAQADRKDEASMTEMSVHRIKSIRINEQEYVSFKTITVTATDTGGNEIEFTMYTNDMQLTTGANHE